MWNFCGDLANSSNAVTSLGEISESKSLTSMRSTCGSMAETKRQFSGNILDMLPEKEKQKILLCFSLEVTVGHFEYKKKVKKNLFWWETYKKISYFLLLKIFLLIGFLNSKQKSTFFSIMSLF